MSGMRIIVLLLSLVFWLVPLSASAKTLEQILAQVNNLRAKHQLRPGQAQIF
jgi:hypothetical protein